MPVKSNEAKQPDQTESTQKQTQRPGPNATDKKLELSPIAPPSETGNGEDVSPYQLLNLLAGNAQNLSFDYSVYLHETKETETGTFYKKGELAACVFTTRNMKGEPVTVREIERDERVHYVMESDKRVVSYPGWAEDMLFYEMMKAAATTPKSIRSKDRFRIYEYELPFAQDDAITFTYRFFMQDDKLEKLEFCVDDFLQKTYRFSDFRQEEVKQKVFAVPTGYAMTRYDYPYHGEHIPPWWENDGLADL